MEKSTISLIVSAVALVFSGAGLFESWQSHRISYMQTRPVLRIESVEGERENTILKLSIRIRNDGQGAASRACSHMTTLADKVSLDFESCAKALLLAHETGVIDQELSPWLDAKRYDVRPVTLPVRLMGHLDYVDAATGQKFSDDICFWWWNVTSDKHEELKRLSCQ